MDSKIIYAACHHNVIKINWETFENEIWVYCGVEEDFEDTKATEFVRKFFTEPNIFIVVDRKNSFEITTELAIQTLKKYFNKDTEVILSNKLFTKMVEFNKIGVMKKGSMN
jgi:ABC-type transport system involved in Fe-S cluster assembly fused permease/ATPase subunit